MRRTFVISSSQYGREAAKAAGSAKINTGKPVGKKKKRKKVDFTTQNFQPLR